jgi:hypothetical protein
VRPLFSVEGDPVATAPGSVAVLFVLLMALDALEHPLSNSDDFGLMGNSHAGLDHTHPGNLASGSFGLA